MSEIEVPAMAWRKSSYSESGNCVEVAFVRKSVFVRDSKDPDGPVLSLSYSEWASFLAALQEGEYEI